MNLGSKRFHSAPDLSFELSLWQAGLLHIAGIDEAGRGALAGPVVAAVVLLPAETGILAALAGVRDSKQMTPAQRHYWADIIRRNALVWAVGMASSQEIDQVGILSATRMAAQRALNTLSVQPDHLLLDCLFLPECSIPQTALVKGDCRSLSIAAASVLAKVARDDLMRTLEQRYPGYGFASHKGYGTAFHRQAIQQKGILPIHRRTFEPIKTLLSRLQPSIQ